MTLFDPNGTNRSPHQTFPRSTFVIDRGDPDILPKPTIVRPSFERQPFGGRERGGAQGGELHPDGLGPFPDDLFTATDLARLPWTRKRGNEWTTAPFRAAVLAWLAAFFRARPEAGLIGWDVEEAARGNRQATRMPPARHYLRIGITQRVRGAPVRVEVGVDFDFPHRVPEVARLRLERTVEPTFDALLVAIV